MIEKLKAPFWFGLPVYAWVAGAVALVAGAGYFFFYARAGTSSAVPQLDASAGNTDLAPYPDPGGGLPVPPTPSFDPNGPPIPYSGGVTYLTAQPGANPTSTLVSTGTTHATSGAVAHNGKSAETAHQGKQAVGHGGKTAERGGGNPAGVNRGRTTSGASGRIAGTAR